MARNTNRPRSHFGVRWGARFLRHKLFLIFALILAIFTLLFFLKTIYENRSYYDTVKRQDVIRSTSMNGEVISSVQLSLFSDQNKKISQISVKKEDKVEQGQALVTFSNTKEKELLKASEASLLSARAKYNKVLEGSSNKEIKLVQANLENTKKTHESLVSKARIKLYSEGLIALSQNETLGNPPIIKGEYSALEESQYILTYNEAKKEVVFSGAEKGALKINQDFKPLGKKGLMISFPDKNYPKNSSWKVAIPNKDSDNYSANLKAYNEALSNSTSAISKSQAELDLIRATARQSEVDEVLADMLVAQAAVDRAKASLENTILRAPVDGKIESINVKINQTVATGDSLLTIKDDSNLYFESTVNEEEMKGIAIGQPATVKIDVQPNRTFKAVVSSIDESQAEATGQTYKIKSLLIGAESLQSGQTGSITIKTAELLKVLTLPERAIKNRNGRSTVMLLTEDGSNKYVVREVTIGLKGNNDIIEIQNGLNEGDRVFSGDIEK